MSNLEPVSLRVRLLKSFDELPPAAVALFAPPGAGDLFQTLDWIAYAHGRRAGDQARLFLVERAGAHGAEPVALLPALYSRLYTAHRESRVIHFLQGQEQPYQPLTSEQGVDSVQLAKALGAWLAANPGAYDVLRISPLDPSSPFARSIVAELRAGANWIQVYGHATNRYERVAGQTFADYLARRPRALREALAPSTRLLMDGGRGAFSLVSTPALLRDAAAAIDHVIDQAPVEGEPDPPGYMAAMLELAAQANALRLGLFFLDQVPVAMQLWVVNQRTAHLLRLWEAPEQRTFPVDDVLAQMMALCLIDGDHVDELDFGGIAAGWADEWAPQSRERIGVAVFNRRSWRGLAGALRHIGVNLLRTLPARLGAKLLTRR